MDNILTGKIDGNHKPTLLNQLFSKQNERLAYNTELCKLHEANNKRIKEGDNKHYLEIANRLVALGQLFEYAQPSIGLSKRDYCCYAAMFYNAAIKILRMQSLPLSDYLSAVNEKIKEDFLTSVSAAMLKLPNNLLGRQFKDNLAMLRRHCKDELEKINRDQLFFGSFEAYKKRAAQIQVIYTTIANNLKKLFSDMVSESIRCLGDPPCNWSVVLFGSLAKGAATPYSDIEFGILIEDMNQPLQETESGKCRFEEIEQSSENDLKNDKNKEYFKDLTAYLALQIIELGETSIPLELLKNEEGIAINLDDLLTAGFQFDLGGKTPLNRKRLEDYIDPLTLKVIYPAGSDKYDLIATPKEMAKYIEDEYFAADKLLPIEIAGSSHLMGHKSLTENFLKRLWQYLKEESNGRPRHEVRAIDILYKGVGGMVPDLEKFAPKIGDIHSEGKLYNVKQEIYRLPDRILDGVHLFYGYSPNNLEGIVNIGNKAREQLLLLDGIAKEMRLSTYLTNQGQREVFSIHQQAEIDGSLHEILNQFCLVNKSIDENSLLFYFYYISLPLCAAIHSLCSGEKNIFKNASLFDDNYYAKAYIYKRLYQTESSMNCFKEFTKVVSISNKMEDCTRYISALKEIGHFYERLESYDAAICTYIEAIEMIIKILPNSTDLGNNGDIYLCAFYNSTQNRLLTTLLKSYPKNELVRELIAKQINKTLEDLSFFGKNIFAMSDILQSVYHLFMHMEDYPNAIIIMQSLLKATEEHLGKKADASIASIFHDLAKAYSYNHEYNEAIAASQKALSIYKIYYGNHPHHRLINMSENLGWMSERVGNNESAVQYYQYALQISSLLISPESLYRNCGFLEGLAKNLARLGLYDKAIISFYQLEEMSLRLQNVSPSLFEKLKLKLEDIKNIVVDCQNWQKLGEAHQYVLDNKVSDAAMIYQEFKIDINNMNSFENLYRMACRHGKVKDAIDIAKVVLRLFSNQLSQSEINRWHYFLSELHHINYRVKNNTYDKVQAEYYFKELLLKAPNRIDYLGEYANFLYQNNELEHSKKILTQVINRTENASDPVICYTSIDRPCVHKDIQVVLDYEVVKKRKGIASIELSPKSYACRLLVDILIIQNKLNEARETLKGFEEDSSDIANVFLKSAKNEIEQAYGSNEMVANTSTINTSNVLLKHSFFAEGKLRKELQADIMTERSAIKFHISSFKSLYKFLGLKEKSAEQYFKPHKLLRKNKMSCVCI